MMPLVKRFAPLVALALVAAVARADGGPTLHEFVPDLGSEEGTMLVSSGGAEPDAIVYQGEVLPAPEGGAIRADEQPMRARAGDGRETEEPGRRSPTFRPDRITDLDGAVPYYAVFTPTIAPFKRVTAYDTVTLAPDGTPILGIGSDAREAVEPLGADAEAPAGRAFDRFWGSVPLDFSEGSVVPFPSVAPEARILTLRTEPSVLIRIEKDPADNFYARIVGAPPQDPVRVVFLTDAPRDYLGAPLPDAPVDALAHRLTALPASVQRDAESFAADFGLSRASRFDEALRALTEHFRSFEESSDPPRDSGNIYLDLARGMRGICRHRVYGFVITAQALGMHARFVHNEAHAWAEVELPGAGWLRIDLGGAATGLEARGAQDRPTYAPDVPDPLPRPEAYERAYEEARRMSGLRAPDAAAGQGGAQGSNGAGGAGQGSSEPGPGDDSVPATHSPGDGPRQPLELALDRRSFEVFRGRELEVTGVARGSEGGVSGLRVEMLLRAPRGGAERLLGVTVTREAGVFRGVFGVPPDLAVGDYRLVVRTPGDERFAPARAE